MSKVEDIICIILFYITLAIMVITLINDIVISKESASSGYISDNIKNEISSNYVGKIITMSELKTISKKLLNIKGIIIEIGGTKYNYYNSIYDIDLTGYLSKDQTFEIRIKDSEQFIVDFFAL